MKKTIKFGGFSLLLFSIVLLTSCFTMTPEKSAMQKRQITTKLVNGNYDNIFASVITVLQDNEYIIKNTDKSTGLITAEVNRDAGMFTKLLSNSNSGVYTSGTKVEINVMVNKINADDSEVRMRIQECTYNNAGGITSSNQIYDEKIYSNFFNNIQTEVKRREALNRT